MFALILQVFGFIFDASIICTTNECPKSMSKYIKVQLLKLGIIIYKTSNKYLQATKTTLRWQRTIGRFILLFLSAIFLRERYKKCNFIKSNDMNSRGYLIFRLLRKQDVSSFILTAVFTLKMALEDIQFIFYDYQKVVCLF